MKKYADNHRIERKFSEGDWVYLKIQPYRQLTLGGPRNQKLTSKFYGPFEILQCVGSVAYRLNLPPGCLLHPVFHVSQLKGKLGASQIFSPTLPLGPPVPTIALQPHLILGRRMVPRHNVAQVQLLVQWKNQNLEDATWEDYEWFASQFLDFIREDTNFVEEGVMRREIGEMKFVKEERNSGGNLVKLLNGEHKADGLDGLDGLAPNKENEETYKEDCNYFLSSLRMGLTET